MKNLNLMIFSLFIMLISSCNQSTKQSDQTNQMTSSNSNVETQQLLGGTHEALCYSGFRTGQHPDRGTGAINPTKAQILEDLTLMSEHLDTKLIRLYDCGENTQDVLQVIKVNNLDMKVLLGIWLKAELSAHETCAWLTEPIPESTLQYNKSVNLKEIETGISLANQYRDIVVAVNVGNEALVEWNDHKVDIDTMIAYVKNVQRQISQPVTVADNYLWWAEKGAALAETVDFVAIHVYPVWEGKSIDEAMDFTLQNIKQVKDSLSNSQIVITEAGWATISSEFGERASEEAQARYYRELMDWSEANDLTTFFFEAFDEDWKGDPSNPMGAEKHWGLFNVDRTPKKVVLEVVK